MPIESVIPFLDADSLRPAPTDVGQLISSSQGLGWDGVHVERGRNEHFETQNVLIPEHYFVLLLSTELRWEASAGRGFAPVLTRQGEVMINPAHTVMSTRVPQPSEFAIVTLSPDKLMNSLTGHGLRAPGAFQQQFQVQDALLRQLMLTLLAEAEGGGANGRLFVDSLSTALALHYIQRYGQGLPAEEPAARATPGLDARRLQRVREMLEQRYAEDLSLDELAQAAAMSRFHFVRRFKASTGLSPYQYLLKQRIEVAQRLLRAADEPIAQVAQAVGFADQSAFGAHFRRLVGTTPRQWRAQRG